MLQQSPASPPPPPPMVASSPSSSSASSSASVSSLSPPSSPEDASRKGLSVHNSDGPRRLHADNAPDSKFASSPTSSPRFLLPPKPSVPRRRTSSSEGHPIAIRDVVRAEGSSESYYPDKPAASATASLSSLRSPRFAARGGAGKVPSTTTPPRPRSSRKKAGGVTWLHDHAHGSATDGYNRGRLDSVSSSCSSVDAACGKSHGCSYSDDDESDTCTTDTSHTTSTATAHNRRGGSSNDRRSGSASYASSRRQEGGEGEGSGSADWNWFQHVRATESALDQALQRRHQNHPGTAAASPDAEIPYYCTLLGNLHFRRGGGGQQACPSPSSYQVAESYYNRAIQWCEHFQRASQGNNDVAMAQRLHLVMADARANLGAVMWTTGRVDLAVATLQQALEGYDRCHRLAEGAITTRGDDGSKAPLHDSDVPPSLRLDSSVANVWHQLGLARRLQGRHGEALECLQRALYLRQQRAAALKDALAPSDPAAVDAALASATASAAVSAAVVDIASTYDAMGKVLGFQGEWRAAVLHHQKAAELLVPLVPRRALSVIETIVRTCLQLRNGSSGDALAASPASASSSESTALPENIAVSDSHDAIKEVKSWLDGLLWRLPPLREIESAGTSAGRGPDCKELATLRREVRDAAFALASQLGLDGHSK